MQLVRVIEVGMDVNGDSSPDLDPSRIYYVGQSFGGINGTELLAVEPNVRAGDFTSACGPWFELFRLSPVNRNGLGNFLAARVPSLINPPGVTEIGGVSVGSPPYFNENMPLRDGIPLLVRLENGTSNEIRSPVINTVPGAMAIQQLFENSEWVMQAGDPVAYAPHLRKDPLPGMPAKSLLFQFAKGDQQCVNPAETAILRAGDVADRTLFFRNDLARADHPELDRNPHRFMVNIFTNPATTVIAREAQRQIATFFESDGKTIIQPEPKHYFEVPIQGPLPEDLNYIS
jgi:hypothetical protein